MFEDEDKVRCRIFNYSTPDGEVTSIVTIEMLYLAYGGKEKTNTS